LMTSTRFITCASLAAAKSECACSPGSAKKKLETRCQHRDTKIKRQAGGGRTHLGAMAVKRWVLKVEHDGIAAQASGRLALDESRNLTYRRYIRGNSSSSSSSSSSNSSSSCGGSSTNNGSSSSTTSSSNTIPARPQPPRCPEQRRAGDQQSPKETRARPKRWVEAVREEGVECKRNEKAGARVRGWTLNM